MKNLKLKWLLLSIILSVAGISQVWGWNQPFLTDSHRSWNTNTYGFTYYEDGKSRLYIYAPNNMEFKLVIDGTHVSMNSYEFTCGGTGSRFYSNNSNSKYVGYSGIVGIYADQKTDDKNKEPWVWFVARPIVHIRHNWGHANGDNDGWTDESMTDNNDGTYTYNGNFGYNLTYVGITDVDYNVNGSNYYKKFENIATVYGSPSVGDPCVYEYNADGYAAIGSSTTYQGTLTIRKLCSITYNANSASVTGSVPSNQTNLPAGTETTIATNTGSLGLSNYTLSGWNTAADGSGTHYDLGGSITITGDLTLYAEWKQEVDLLKGTNGTADGSSNVAIYLNATSLAAHTDATRTGYDMTGYWTAASDGTQIVDEDGSTFIHNVTGYTASDGKWNRTAAISELYAQWSAHTYTVTLKPGLGGSGSDGSLTVNYDATAINDDMLYSFTNTGYSISGWYPSQESDLKVLETNGNFAASSVEGYITNGKWSKASDCDLHAHWTANTYKITFDATSNGGAIINDGSTYEESSVRKINATYDATVSGTMPTARKDGYHFNGWYSAASGGLQIIDESGVWQANKSGYTDGSKNWKCASPTTLYAQYSNDISGVSFSPSSVLPSEEITVTTNFTDSKNPEGTYSFCYKLTTGAGIEMQVQPTFTNDGLSATFEAPGTPGTYSVEARLYAEASHDCATAGSPVASYTAHGTTFTVESTNAVTVMYKCGDVELRSSTTVQATASQRAVDVTAPEIAGLTFTGWTRGANVTRASGDNDNVNPISIYASAAGTLTANYSQSGYVYFKNTLGWDHVYLFTYNNKYYWDDTYGTGVTIYNEGVQYCIEKNIEMSLVDGTTDVYYCKPTNVPAANTSFVFANKTSEDQFFGSTGGDVEAVRVNDDFSTTNHMVVPEIGTYITKNGGKAKYYTRYFFAPTLMDWGWTLRGSWAWSTASEFGHFTAPTMGSLTFQVKRYFDTGGTSKDIKLYESAIIAESNNWGKASGVINGTSTSVGLVKSEGNISMTTTIPGEYVFTLTYGPSGDARGSLTSNLTLDVTYPVKAGDFRLVYTDGSTYAHPGNIIRKRNNGLDTVSMYVAAGNSANIKVQPCSSVGESSVTWSSCSDPTYAGAVNFASILSKGGAGVYNFIIQQNADASTATIIKVEKYTGQFYIRTDCVDDKWEYWKSKDKHMMTFSEYSATSLDADKQFSHYYVKDIDNGTNIKFTVANDYSEAITDTVENGDLSGSWADIYGDQTLNCKMNVRFTYNQKTNKIWRAYTEGPQDPDYMVLKSNGTNVYADVDGEKGDPDANISFEDLGNWVYQVDVWADVNSYIKLTAEVTDHAGGTHIQYLKGENNETYDASNAELLLGGNSVSSQHMRITYDFKTDRMITSWLPPQSAITGELQINADVMLIRKHQEEAKSITFTSGTGNKLTNVKTIYGVMQFDEDIINNSTISRYARDLYWISFPFDVKLSDVFGFGTYGVHWIIEYYDGKGRAKNGFWADSPSNWKFVTPAMREHFVLNANEGYILALDLDEMWYNSATKGDHADIWDNVTTVYLYFPSSAPVGTIKTTDKTVNFTDQNEYKCEINRGTTEGDRRIKDSYWHCIGVPSYAGAEYSLSTSYTSGTPIVADADWTAINLPFLYEWNSTSNTLVPQTTSPFDFKAMHSYLVQYSKSSMSWTNVSATPSSVASRVATLPEREYNLSLLRDSIEEDHTYVRLTDDEGISNAFEFNYDLSKEYNAGRGNIWTVTADTVEVAGNSMPKPLQTTVVPVGVKVVANGEYTLAMPEGTNGEDVYLIDNAYGTRTNLGLMPYTVTLTAGTYDSRFALEFAPIQDSPTSLENDGLSRSDELNDANDDVRKVFVGGRLYIIRDGKVYDAAGQRVE